MESAAAAVVLVLLALTSTAQACIYKLGSSPDSLAVHPGGTEWGYGFHGDDWVGVNAAGAPWVCATGKKQSPINIPPLGNIKSTVNSKLQTKWEYPALQSNGSNIEVINNGHTIQVEWLSAYASDVTVAVPANKVNSSVVTAVLGMKTTAKNVARVKATPLQFHFHSYSEHVFQGKQYPLELHIVHNVPASSLPACGPGGCFAVIGIPFELTDGPDNELLKPIWDHLPTREGTINFLPAGLTFNLDALLPNQGHYITYEGSLTTPPCTEGLLWHVFTKPTKISKAQLVKYQLAVGFKDCVEKNDTDADRRHRHLLADDEENGDPNSWNCTVVAYGNNARNSQDINGRVIRKCTGNMS